VVVDGLWAHAVLPEVVAGPDVYRRWPASREQKEEDGGTVNSLARRHWPEARAGRRCWTKRARRRSHGSTRMTTGGGDGGLNGRWKRVKKSITSEA
jgi:hypothetical protein